MKILTKKFVKYYPSLAYIALGLWIEFINFKCFFI